MGSIQDFERCLHGKEAPCSAACPFRMNVRELVSKLARGSFGPAYNLYRSAVAFPELVSRLCAAPCQAVCAEMLAMPALERSAIAFSRSREPVRFTLPAQKKNVAIVGGSLGGLGCALRLAEKQYAVTIFEARALPGGSAVQQVGWDVVKEELQLQFKFASCTYIPNTRIEDPLALAREFDAVYLAPGTHLDAQAQNVFSDSRQDDALMGLAAALGTYQQILWYLQTGVRKSKEEPASVLPAAEVPARSQVSFSKGEARQEAARCTKCDCNACVENCVLLQQYGQSPLNLARDIGTSTNLFHETQGHAAMREIGSCTDCGLCAQVCPVGIDIGKIIIGARHTLHDKRELPEAHHEYWLRDMAFANGPQAAVSYLPGEGKCEYLFFPGCQTGGSDPRYVSMTYERLCKRIPATGLLLRCCGNPALWAGDQTLFRQELKSIRQFWLEAGKPTILFTCPSCSRTFARYLPEIPQKMLYELEALDAVGISCYNTAAIFDPCAARGRDDLGLAVRSIAAGCGVTLEELPGSAAQCCSWGGHGYCVNPLFVMQQSAQQQSRSNLPYICYCTNCRDILCAQGKDCRHILDYILGINEEPCPAPTVTQRRNNRRQLKQTLALQYGLCVEKTEVTRSMKLNMSQEVAQKLSADLILEEDLQEVIAQSELDGRLLMNPENGHLVAHRKLGYLTYWVEFVRSGRDEYTVFNAYSHRMIIKHEEM